MDITEPKGVEQDPDQGEDELRALIAAMPAGVCTCDGNGRIAFFNRRAVEIWGMEPAAGETEELFFRTLSLQSLSGEPIDRTPLAVAIREGVSTRGEVFVIARTNGTRAIMRMSVDPLYDGSGTVSGAIAILQGETDISNSAGKLKTSESRFRTLFELAPVSIWEQDFSAVKAEVDRLKSEGVSDFAAYVAAHSGFVAECAGKVRLLDINLATVKLFRATEKEELLQSLHRIFTPQTMGVFAAEIVAIAEGRPHFESEAQYKALDGSTINALCRIAFSPEDPSLSRVLVALTDIGDRKRSDEERARLLRTAELLNDIGATINSELDPQRLTQKVTDLARQATGAQFGALFHNLTGAEGGKYVLYTLSGAPREAFAHFPLPRATEIFAPTLNGEGIVMSDDITKDPRYGKSAPYHGMPKGHLPVRSYLAAPVVLRSGEVLGGLFFGHEASGVFTPHHADIVRGVAAQAAIALDNARLYAASRRDQQDLARSNAELRRANADLEQFAYSASHDLQEPIRNIAVYGEILSRNHADQLDAKGQRALQFMTAGARRMELLVRALLAYTQAGNTDETAVEMVNAAEIVAKARMTLSTAIERTGAAIAVGPMPTVRVHPVQLEQVFQNLMSNAIKYARDGEAPFLSLTAERDGGYWRFSVKDNGIGILPEYHARVFGIFKRLHSDPKYSGSGIGLAICQRIVERNGGTIWVESAGDGNGSTFHFTLPAEGNEEARTG